uniref:MSP domain-containing protein n=1 Tax=Araucaria cunninghamii TaxID=56994 RepID=A0A0D6QXB9_ARACU
MTNELVTIRPAELKFPFEVKKQSSCSLELINNTDNYVAFKVKTTSPKKYCVRPNTGIIEPKATCDVTVTMQAQKEAPPDMQCKDKFLVQCVIAPSGTIIQDVTPEMFSKEPGKVIEENKLRVVYVSPPQPPTIQESPEEGSTQKVNGNVNPPSSDQVPTDISELKTKLSEAQSAISKLAEEKADFMKQKQKLEEELTLANRSDQGRIRMGFSFLFVCFIGLVGIIVGYFFRS